MSDISSFEQAIQSLKNGVHPTLGVTIGSHRVIPGEQIKKKETHKTPVLTAPADLPQGSYTIICVDLDAPFVSWNALSPALHWAQTGYQIQSPSRELKSNDPIIAEYAGAGPPPGAAPHRYVFLLYSHKPDSNISPNVTEKPIALFSRMRFDVEGLKEKLGLDKIEAVNHFTSN